MTRAFVHSVRKILYRRPVLVAIVAAMALLVASAFAQEDRPQIFPGERKPVHKQDLGPRALAVLQLGAKGRSSLLPIAILINGKFWDASVYKADPVPMALDSGTVYEVEQCGSSQGLFTVNSALHRTTLNAPDPWIATGSWVPKGTVVAQTTHKAEITPLGLETKDEPPRLTRSGGGGESGGNASKPAAGTKPAAPSSTPPATTAGPSDQPPSSSTSSNPPKSGSSGGGGPGQPGSGRPTSGSTGSNTPSTPAENKGGGSQPADSKSAPAKAAEASVPASDSGASEENRPKLRRGKPTGPLPGDDEVEGYSKPGESATTSSSTALSGAKSGMKANQPPMQLIPAISDAGGPEPHSYTFDWIKDEEQERQRQMTVMAKQQLRAYLTAQAKATITAKSPARATRKAAKEAEPILENIKMTGYDLWTSNQPVIVFSADAQLPESAAAHSDEPAGLQYSILLVAYPDIYNNLHKLYAGVTDKYHLDVTPRLELIDAVDADGDGFGELLFRETSDAGTGWVIYRATADKLWKMYDSLNPG